MKYDCLIVDDEKPLAESTAEYFNMFGINTRAVFTYSECIEFLSCNSADVILLDINLGDCSGFELCKRLREKTNAPIIFISARSSDDDVLIALNIGGDDYIRKPYTLSVLLAKVKVVLKRLHGTENSLDVYKNNRITVDFIKSHVFVNDTEIKLKAMEYKLLKYLIENKNSVVSKEDIFNNVWGDNFTGDGTLNVHIRHLREKLELDPNNPLMIRTVWGTGYTFSDAEVGK